MKKLFTFCFTLALVTLVSTVGFSQKTITGVVTDADNNTIDEKVYYIPLCDNVNGNFRAVLGKGALVIECDLNVDIKEIKVEENE